MYPIFVFAPLVEKQTSPKPTLIRLFYKLSLNTRCSSVRAHIFELQIFAEIAGKLPENYTDITRKFHPNYGYITVM